MLAQPLAPDKPLQQVVVDDIRVLDRPVLYERTPLDRFRQAMGEEMAALFAWFNDVGDAADIPALRAAYPPLATLEGYLRDAGWGDEAANAARP